MRKVEYILIARSKRSLAAIFHFDIAKAFDSVWHYGLVWKLIPAGFPAAFCRLIFSCLQDKTFMVKVGDTCSSERSIHRCVPQESVLGSHFFSLFMSAMRKFFSNLFMNFFPELNYCEYFQYANDTAIPTYAGKKNSAAKS